MMDWLARVRNLLGFGETLEPVIGKRDRSGQDEDYSDDDFPTHKRAKRLSDVAFPRIMSEHAEPDDWEQRPRASNVRYVPIQVEGYPSSSTPNDLLRGRDATAAVRIGSTDLRRGLRPTRPIVHALHDDDPEISWVEPKRNMYNKSSSSRVSQEKFVLIDDDDEDEQDENEQDVVYVKRVEPRKDKYFVSRLSDLDQDRGSPRQHYRLNKYSACRTENISPKPKFKSPAGITKTYRPKPVSQNQKWLQPIRTSTLGPIPLRNRLSQISGNSRSAIMEAFNLEEKKNYKELIKRMAVRAKPGPISKPIEVIDLADEYTFLRENQRTQKYALNQLNLPAQRIASSTMNETLGLKKECNPVTAASLNSSDSEVELVANSSDAWSNSSTRIQPVNSLKAAHDGQLRGGIWAKELSNKYRKMRKETLAKSLDVAAEINLIEGMSRDQNIAQLQRSLRDDLKLTDSEELVEEEEVEIPQLTPEQLKLVDRSLGPGPAGQLLIDKFGLRIHRRDLQTLAGLNWLNDEVINFYMNLITQRSTERSDLPKVYTANTFFYPKLMQSGQAGLRRWTRKVDIFAHQLMVIPVHLNVHWCLCLVELEGKRVAYLDSMGGANNACLEAVLQYLRDEHQDKKGRPFDDSGWRKEQLKDIPQQMNGSDCGMFACTFAEYASRRAPFTFKQSDMPRLRRKVAYEILQGKLLL